MKRSYFFFTFVWIAFAFSSLVIAQDKIAIDPNTATTRKTTTTTDSGTKVNGLAAKSTTAPAPKTPTPIKLGSLVVTGSVRARLEHWNFFDAPPANDSYNFGAVTLRLAIMRLK